MVKGKAMSDFECKKMLKYNIILFTIAEINDVLMVVTMAVFVFFRVYPEDVGRRLP
jgi:hypothetical protein